MRLQPLRETIPVSLGSNDNGDVTSQEGGTNHSIQFIEKERILAIELDNVRVGILPMAERSERRDIAAWITLIVLRHGPPRSESHFDNNNGCLDYRHCLTGGQYSEPCINSTAPWGSLAFQRNHWIGAGGDGKARSISGGYRGNPPACTTAYGARAVTDSYQADREAVIQILNQALATVVCVLRYKRHYYMASGIHAQAVAQEFQEHASEEQGHADMIAERITQLDGEPNFDPDELVTRSHSEYVEGSTLSGSPLNPTGKLFVTSATTIPLPAA